MSRLAPPALALLWAALVVAGPVHANAPPPSQRVVATWTQNGTIMKRVETTTWVWNAQARRWEPRRAVRDVVAGRVLPPPPPPRPATTRRITGTWKQNGQVVQRIETTTWLWNQAARRWEPRTSTQVVAVGPTSAAPRPAVQVSPPATTRPLTAARPAQPAATRRVVRTWTQNGVVKQHVQNTTWVWAPGNNRWEPRIFFQVIVLGRPRTVWVRNTVTLAWEQQTVYDPVPTPAVDQPAPAVDAPAPTPDQPAPSTETPPQPSETPPVETPPPPADTPPPTTETPPPAPPEQPAQPPTSPVSANESPAAPVSSPGVRYVPVRVVVKVPVTVTRTLPVTSKLPSGEVVTENRTVTETVYKEVPVTVLRPVPAGQPTAAAP